MTEKASGQVKRVTNGVVTGVVLDLAVNSNSERGLLGIALHPDFPQVPFVYLYNTESTTGSDTNVAANVPLLGNRVDRFRWNGSTLSFDKNIINYARSRTTVTTWPIRHCPCCVATTMGACCASVRTASGSPSRSLGGKVKAQPRGKRNV